MESGLSGRMRVKESRASTKAVSHSDSRCEVCPPSVEAKQQLKSIKPGHMSLEDSRKGTSINSLRAQREVKVLRSSRGRKGPNFDTGGLSEAQHSQLPYEQLASINCPSDEGQMATNHIQALEA